MKTDSNSLGMQLMIQVLNHSDLLFVYITDSLFGCLIWILALDALSSILILGAYYIISCQA